jgi:hypothetical protein
MKLEATYQRRHNRENAQGLAPINLRVTLQQVRSDLSTGLFCPAAYWPKGTNKLVLPADEAQQVLPEYSKEVVAELNNKLYEFRQDIEEMYKRLRRPDLRGPVVEVTAEMLREALRGPLPAKVKARAQANLDRPLLQVASSFLAVAEGAPESARLAPGTIASYHTRYKTLLRYLKSERTTGLLARVVDIPWCRRYERWLVSEEGGHCPLSMRKQVNFVQMALSFGVHEGWVPTVVLHGYKFQTRNIPVPILSLPIKEVQQLVEALPELDLPARRAVAGWLFCCYTGLSWVDYRRFCERPGSYLFAETGADGKTCYWLRMVRQKMKNRKPQGFSVPLFDAAADLLIWYRGKLPHTHSANINLLLHRVETELGLSQSLTTKLARSTFSQMRRDEGYSDEAVAAMMGDTVSVMNKHYSKVSEKRIALEIGHIGQPTSFLLAA